MKPTNVNNLNKPVKFLIIRFSSIGDIVLTTPVIRCLKQQYPNAEIHFVVKKKFKNVVEHNPYIDQLHLLDGNLKELVKTFKAEHFDYIIDLHKTLRSYLLRFRLWRPTFSFRKLSVEKLIMNKFHIDLLPKDVHIVERNLKTVEPLGVKNDNKPVGTGFTFRFTRNTSAWLYRFCDWWPTFYKKTTHRQNRNDLPEYQPADRITRRARGPRGWLEN